MAIAWKSVGILRQGGMAVLLALAMLLPAPPARATAPTAAPLARIWVYREYEPFISLARPYVRLNGAVVGVSEPGGAFHVDVAPGAYLVTVDSDGVAPNQFVTVDVGAGQQAFVKVLGDINWDSGGGGKWGAGWQRDTFYTWQIQPPAAAAEIARLPNYRG
jgi:hypothetical protein